MAKNETLTVRIDDWRNWDIEKNRPLRFTATRTDKNEVVELMVFKSSNFDNDPAENIREHLASIDPIGYVGTVQNVTVRYTKEHQGIRQFYLYDMEAVEGANEAPEQPSDPKPVVSAYAHVSRMEIGQATGNGRNGGFILVAEYYKKHGELPNDEWLIACAERVDFFANALMNPPTLNEDEVEEDDDVVGTVL